jgi:DNA-binding transcriptional LysR family regulator
MGDAMDPTRIEVSHLRHLVEIADRGDLADAARHLGVPTAVLARRLDSLGELAGAAVFERGPTGLVPTAGGADVVRTARAVLRDLADLTRSARGGTGTLRLAAVDALLVPAVGALARARPDLVVIGRTTGSAAAVEAVASGTADLAAAVRWPRPSRAGSSVRPERRVPGIAVELLVPQSHRLAGGAVIDLGDLAGDAWCVREDAAEPVAAECRRVGLEPDVRYRTTGDAELLDLVAAGHAVALTAHPARPVPGVVRLRYRRAATVEWTVTRGGHVDAEDAEVVVRALQELAGRPRPARPVTDGEVGTAGRPVRIAAGAGLDAVVGVRHLHDEHALHVEVTPVDEVDLAQVIDSGAADLALHHRHAFVRDWLPVWWPRRVVGPDEPVLVAVAGAVEGPVRIEELGAARWAVPTSPAGQAVVRALCRLAGADARIAVVFDDPCEVASAVAAGRVVRLAGRGAPAAGSVCVPVAHPAARRDTVLVWHPDRPLGPLADVVAGELRRPVAPRPAPRGAN